MTTITAPLVLAFTDIDAGQIPLVGGKAANLGVLTRAGLPVPPGVCVTTEAYRRVAEGAGLDGVLDALATAGPGERPALATRARELLLAAPVPGDIAAAVRESATGPVAVRSSATAEDLPDASFAGQQDTYLNIIGSDAVLDAVRRCWASLWTDRAVAYRAANGIDHGTVRLAVVVQRMVDAAYAGVMFTANPVTGRRRQAVIDAAPGLGEAVVSGAVNPDHYVVDEGGRIVENRPGDKTVAVRSLAGGGTETVTLGAAGEPCLPDERVRELAALGFRVEDHYGAPQDTEWAIGADGTLWLTQSRPITTLYPPLPERSDVDGRRVYLSFNVAQGVFRPFTPMGLSMYRPVSAGVAADLFGRTGIDPYTGHPGLVTAGERLFLDITPAARSPLGRAVVPRVFDIMEARSAVTLRGLFDDPGFGVLPVSRAALARRALRTAARFRIPPRLLAALLRPDAARRRLLGDLSKLKATLRARETATATERLDHVVRTLNTAISGVIPRIGGTAGGGAIALGLASRLLRGRTEAGELPTVLRGLPHNVTTEMDLMLWAIAERIRGDRAATELLLGTPAAELTARREDLPAVIAEGLGGFLELYGFRTVAEIDPGLPRWSDDPTHILGVLANYLRLDDPALAPDAMFDRGAREAVEMIGVLSRRAGGWRGRLVRWALGRARSLLGLREMPKFWGVTVFAAARADMAVIGADLAGRGLLDAGEDVFFLTLTEVRDALDGSDADLRALVRARRATYGRELRRRHVPRMLLSDGTEPEALAVAVHPADGDLTGTPASAGTVTGIARVVLEPVGAHLEPGEILVAPSTDPGWTPLFLTAGGLVMEMGGANSHGSVVAREYGIPAVVGVAGATERIETGQRITVDGTGGVITLQEPEA